MVDFKEVLIQAAQPAVRKIVEIQKDFMDGTGEIKYKLVEDGIAKSPATIGDTASQEIYEAAFNKALGAGNILYKNEEDTGNSVTRGNIASEEDARAKLARGDGPVYRIAIDPIDGTGNYSGQKADEAKKVKERKPVNRSLTELSEAELASPAVRPGWGSMVAIQELQKDGEWKTVASAIYESNSQDKPDDLKGKMYIAETGKQGVSVVNLQTGQDEGLILAQMQTPNKIVAEGGFPKFNAAKDASEAEKAEAKAKTEKQKAGQAAVQAVAKGNGDHLIDFSCVAQSALSAITGKTEGFFQGHPNLHDVLAVAHLAEAAGLSTIVIDKEGTKQALQTGDDIKYPVFMAANPELALAMAEKYIDAAGLDKAALTLRDGDWNGKSFDQTNADLMARAGKDVSGAADLAQAPATKLRKGTG